MTTLVYDTGWIEVFPSGWTITTPWESSDFWIGSQTLWRDEERRRSIIHYLGEVVTAAAWLIEFDDTDNLDGFIQFDRVFAAEFWQPSLNFTTQGNAPRRRDYREPPLWRVHRALRWSGRALLSRPSLLGIGGRLWARRLPGVIFTPSPISSVR
ncbi:hypothetical protein CHELA40_14753 [Chelatococcus asaccharovorans]|nr:hypothetical protein CHELA17_60867 [Chelatococcus asaccharovorans]CAH1679737.1 hypothetical protein CHELA40_14753 [Chelatococcus asaccharovorans]